MGTDSGRLATAADNETAGAAAGQFRPLDEVRREFRVRWYRSPVEPALLRELMRRSDWCGGAHSVGHLLLWAATGALAWRLAAAELWLLLAPALMAHAVVGSFFKGAAIHELGHGTVFRTKWLNGLFTHLFCVLGCVNVYDFKMSHSYHHRYTLHPEGDREVVLPQDPTCRFFYLLQLFTVNVTGGYQSAGLWPVLRQHLLTAAGRYPPATGEGGDYDGEWLRAIYRGAPAMRRRAVWAARCILLYLAGVIAVPIALGAPLLALLLTAHLAVGHWLRWLVGGPMHAGLRDNVPDFRLCVRSNTLDPISEFLYWHMNWHTEHHMYAGVPCYRLAKLYRVIKDDVPAPRTLLGAWREILAIWRRQQEEPDYQYTTPLPPTAHPPVLSPADLPRRSAAARARDSALDTAGDPLAAGRVVAPGVRSGSPAEPWRRSGRCRRAGGGRAGRAARRRTC